MRGTTSSTSRERQRGGCCWQEFYAAGECDGDRITYSDDTGLFDINGTTGLIEFTPGSDQVGTYFVNITVSDGVIIRIYIGKDVKHSNNEKIH
jgi:hypothetical protein